ncbi:hypothetical protein C6A85_93140 [Mycobacterium sp. ITM-2017-0098]|nr:hypothetical protein C6A85_93140 [Mycobacterium sp. ITM-2017-0098]
MYTVVDVTRSRSQEADVSYQVEVVADSVAEAVRCAGGLMFDRRRMGWRVSVVTNDTAHRRALTILGARPEMPGEGDEALAGQDRIVRCRVLPLDLCTTDPSIALKRGFLQGYSELLLWHRDVDSELAGPLHPVRHELSAAARTFKAQALRSIGADVRVDPAEQFWVADGLGSTSSHLGLRRSPSVVGGLPYG